MTPYKVFIVGHEGTTGLRIHERLSNRKDIELLATADEDRKNVEAIKEVAKGGADIVFLCLPDAASKEIMLLSVNYRVRSLIHRLPLERRLIGLMASQSSVRIIKQPSLLKNILLTLVVMRVDDCLYCTSCKSWSCANRLSFHYHILNRL